MSPTPDEIATLLALEPEARAALAGCEGPGWVVAKKPEVFGPPRLALANHIANGCFAWLPADPTAILDAAVIACSPWRPREGVEIGVGRAGMESRRHGREWAAFIEAERGSGIHDAKGASPRLAALRLLAAVWGGR